MKCPKCGYERQPSDSAPEWQCPSCKVAYAKALLASKAQITPAAVKPVQAKPAQPDSQTDEDQLEDEQDERNWLAASGQKIVIYCIIANFVLRSAERSQELPTLLMDTLFFGVAVLSVIGVVKICSGLGKSQNQKILFMTLSFFPLINRCTRR